MALWSAPKFPASCPHISSIFAYFEYFVVKNSRFHSFAFLAFLRGHSVFHSLRLCGSIPDPIRLRYRFVAFVPLCKEFQLLAPNP